MVALTPNSYSGHWIFLPLPSGSVRTDTTNFQNAFRDFYNTGRPVVMAPTIPGAYRIDEPLVNGSPAGVNHQFASNLIGQGSHATRIDYLGDVYPALRFSSHFSTDVYGFSLNGGGKLKAGSIGNDLGREGSGPFGGTMTHGGIFRHVNVGGFERGWKLGNFPQQVSASEILFESCAASGCVKGFDFETYNSLNFLFLMLHLTQCDTGLFTTTAGQIHVLGGSGSANGLEFDLRTGGAFSLRAYRAESRRLAHIAGTDACTTASIEDCETTDPTLPGEYAISSGWGGMLNINGGTYNGGIKCGARHKHAGGISMTQVAVRHPRPFDYESSGGNPGESSPYQYSVSQCVRRDAQNNSVERFPDEIGVWDAATKAPKATFQSSATRPKLARLDLLELGPAELTLPAGAAVPLIRLPSGEVHPLALGAPLQQPDPTGQLAGCAGWYEVERQPGAVPNTELLVLQDSTNYRRHMKENSDTLHTAPFYRLDQADGRPMIEHLYPQGGYSGPTLNLPAGPRTVFWLMKTALPPLSPRGNQCFFSTLVRDETFRCVFNPETAAPKMGVGTFIVGGANRELDHRFGAAGSWPSGWQLWVVRVDGANSVLRLNGVVVDTGILDAAALTGFKLGSSGGWRFDGWWRLFGWYERALPDADIGVLEAWALGKYPAA